MLVTGFRDGPCFVPACFAVSGWLVSCFGKTEDRTESSVAFLLLYLTVIYYGIPRCIIVYYVVYYVVHYIVYYIVY